MVVSSSGYSVVVVNKGPTPLNPSSGSSVFVSGKKGGLVPPMGNPPPGKPGKPGCPPGPPPMLGGGSPIPPIKSEVGLSVWVSSEPGFTPIPVGGRPISPVSIPILGGIVAGETKSPSLSFPPSIVGFSPPGGSPTLVSSSSPFPGPEELSSPGLNGKRLSSVGFTGMGFGLGKPPVPTSCPSVPIGFISKFLH